MSEGDTTALPSSKLLKSLVQRQRTTKSKVDDLNGDFGQAIATAVEKNNLHAAAFKQASKLARMDQVKLFTYLEHFDDYRQKLALDELAGAKLTDAEEDGPGDDDGEGGRVGETLSDAVKRSDQAIKETAQAMKDKDPAGSGQKPPIQVN